jgi:hypothetical protein
MKGILYKPPKIDFIRKHPDMDIQTRRLSGLAEINKEPDKWVYEPQYGWFRQYKDKGLSAFTLIVKPRYNIGEVVYIKEAIKVAPAYTEGSGESYLHGYIVEYPDKAIKLIHLKDIPKGTIVRPFYQKMFMPSYTARYFQKVIDVRAQRLQEITIEDALDEGISRQLRSQLGYSSPESEEEFNLTKAINTFKLLWDSINPDYPWELNPWVFAYTMKFVSPEGEKK